MSDFFDNNDIRDLIKKLTKIIFIIAYMPNYSLNTTFKFLKMSGHLFSLKLNDSAIKLKSFDSTAFHF